MFAPQDFKSMFGHFTTLCIKELSSEKISFSMAICSKCFEQSVAFPVDLFLKQFDNATTFKLKSISLFRYLDNFLEKDKTGLPFQINIA